MKFNTLESLEWDSKFFGYPVAKIILDPQGIEQIDSLFQQITSGKFRLTYFFVPPGEKKLNNKISKKGSLLVDQKVIFSKPAEKHYELQNNVVEFQGTEINNTLIDLVLQAGMYSRFRIDKNFRNNEYEKIYVEWLNKSINKKNASKVFVAERDSDTVGLITLNENRTFADIGLFAVASNFRGHGIGYDLIRTVDTNAYNLGFLDVKVVTQLMNERACRLYKKCNFNIESVTNIYHFWL